MCEIWIRKSKPFLKLQTIKQINQIQQIGFKKTCRKNIERYYLKQKLLET